LVNDILSHPSLQDRSHKGIRFVLLVLSLASGPEFEAVKEAIMGHSFPEDEMIVKMEHFLGHLNDAIVCVEIQDNGVLEFICNDTIPLLTCVLNTKNAKFDSFLQDTVRFKQAWTDKVQ